MQASNVRRRRRRNRLGVSLLIFNVVFYVLLFIGVSFVLIHMISPKKSIRDKGILAFHSGEYSEALKYFDDALAEKQWFSDRVDVDLMLYKADCLIRLDRFSEAMLVYTDVKQKYDEKFWKNRELDYLIEINGNLQKFYQGDYVSTVAGFLSAIENGHPEMNLYAAICYHRQGNYEKMKEYFDNYISVYGMSSFLYFEYGEYYISMGQIDDALKCIEQGITAKDQTYIKQLLFEQAYCYKEKRDYNKAFTLAKDYVMQYPEDEKGQALYDFLDTRVNVDDTLLNNIWDDEVYTEEYPEEEYPEEEYPEEEYPEE